MYGEINAGDIEMLNRFRNLSSTGQKELREYMRYLLCKQYKRELMISIFNNGLLHSLLQNLINLTERDDFPINQIENRLKQIQELYFGIFEKIHTKYSGLVEGLDSCELVKDFGKMSFDNIARACYSGNRLVILMEINEFYEGYYKFAKQKEYRKIIAV